MHWFIIFVFLRGNKGIPLIFDHVVQNNNTCLQRAKRHMSLFTQTAAQAHIQFCSALLICIHNLTHPYSNSPTLMTLPLRFHLEPTSDHNFRLSNTQASDLIPAEHITSPTNVSMRDLNIVNTSLCWLKINMHYHCEHVSPLHRHGAQSIALPE